MDVRLYVIIAGALVLSAWDASLCSDTPTRAVIAPDGSRQAVLFQRDCGATTDFSEQLSIMKVGKPPEGAGNVFIADGNHGPLPAIDLKWTSPHELVVIYDANARIFHAEQRVHGVTIHYEPRTSRR